jgi:hypothetical protein
VTTSIRELLDQARVAQQLAQQHKPVDPGLAIEARQVIGAATAGLRRLQEHWRADWNPDKPAHQLVTALTEACAEVQAGTGPTTTRPAQLVAVAGDAVATLCGPANPAPDRWAIALTVAVIISDAADTYRIHGPALPDRAITAAHAAGLAILRPGRRYVPGAATGVLDLPITPPPAILADPLARAAAAAAAIDRILTLAAIDHTRPPVTVYELRALALAFRTATQLIGTELGTDATRAGQAWEHVRQLARGLRDGAGPAPDGPEPLLRNCAQLHDNLHHWTQQPDHDPATPTLQEILAHVASNAGNLANQAHRFAGRVYAPAWEFPARESRIGELLRRQAVIIDTEDTVVLTEALQKAETATAQLITAGMSIGLGEYPMISPERAPTLPCSPAIDAPGI